MIKKLLLSTVLTAVCICGHAQNNTSIDDMFNAYANGLVFRQELTHPIAEFQKPGDKMVHVSSFKIIDDVVYMTYYANDITDQESPDYQKARFVIAPLKDLKHKKFYDLGYTVNSKSANTDPDLWHIQGEEVTKLYDTILLTIDDDTLFILWTAAAGGQYYRVYRTYKISTGEFSPVQLNYYKVGGSTEILNASGMEKLYAQNGIRHRQFKVDIGLMQKLSSRVENGETWYYSAIYYYAHNAIVKTKDLITWEFVASPDFAIDNNIQWENAVYVKNDRIYYMVRQFSSETCALLTYYDLKTYTWHTPVKLYDTQSRYDFIEYGNELYLVHSPKDRNHLAIMKIDQHRLENSYDVQVAEVPDYFYPFMQTYKGDLYMSYTHSRKAIGLSKISIAPLSSEYIRERMEAVLGISK